MMDCEKYKKWISQEIDQELEEKEAELLRKHLDTCSECTAFRDDLYTLRKFFAEDPAPSPSLDLEQRVVKAFRANKNVLRNHEIWVFAKRMAAAALILVALTLGLFIGSTATVQAVDPESEIHYEDLFQRAPLDDEALLEALITSNNPREALRVYSGKRRQK
jgi:predicted anti-sigma-YlaC factor YlaD